MKITQLKGGSLSSTSLFEDGDKKFIRKKISTRENREYGFVRWYSQLKKLQRFGQTGLFPKILNVAYENNTAYFDIEYLHGYKDIKTILAEDNLTENEIQKIYDAIMVAFNKLHANSYAANPGAPKLYFKEEVTQKLSDSFKHSIFYNFYEFGTLNTFEYNGQMTHGIQNFLPELKNFFDEMVLESEQDIHGNPTLENMMYSFEEDKVVFIDPYEESIIDSKLLDYSQVLQCSRSCYGFINDRVVMVDGSSVWHNLQLPNNLKVFNKMFESNLKQKEIIDVLEATQFIRMLPFKCAAGDFEKAKYFYVHACHLLSKIF